MKPFHLVYLLLLITQLTQAKTVCLYVVGQGSLTNPQVEDRFLDHLQRVRQRWQPDCETNISLVGVGARTYVFNQATNRYQRINSQLVDRAATVADFNAAIARLASRAAPGDTLRLYVGDHGAPGGSIMAPNRFIGPDFLRGALAPWYAKFGRIEALFDHCYSGQMLDALYAENRARGCGISDSNDDVAYSNNEILTGSLEGRAYANRSGTGVGQTPFNQFTLSSDRFLYAYAQRFTPGNCYACSVNRTRPDQGLLADLSDFIYFHAVDLAVSELDRDFASLQERTPAAFKLRPAMSWEEVVRRTGVIDGQMNAAFVRYVAKTPSLQGLMNRKTQLQAEVARWIRTHPGQNVDACSAYFPSLAIDGQIGAARSQFFSGKKIKDFPGLPGNSGALAGETPEEAKAKLTQVTNHLKRFKNWERQRTAYLMRKSALLQMRTRKDTKALATYLNFRRCEQESRL